MLAGEKLTDENRDEVLSTLSSQVIYNLLSSHYFTYFYADDEPIRYKMVEEGSIEMNGAKATLKFNLELAKPTSIYTPDLRLLIFDPSYFVDMSWEHKHAITINEPYAERCHIDVVEPNPTPEQVTYAMSLSVDADQITNSVSYLPKKPSSPVIRRRTNGKLASLKTCSVRCV